MIQSFSPACLRAGSGQVTRRPAGNEDPDGSNRPAASSLPPLPGAGREERSSTALDFTPLAPSLCRSTRIVLELKEALEECEASPGVPECDSIRIAISVATTPAPPIYTLRLILNGTCDHRAAPRPASTRDFAHAGWRRLPTVCACPGRVCANFQRTSAAWSNCSRDLDFGGMACSEVSEAAFSVRMESGPDAGLRDRASDGRLF